MRAISAPVPAVVCDLDIYALDAHHYVRRNERIGFLCCSSRTCLGPNQHLAASRRGVSKLDPTAGINSITIVGSQIHAEPNGILVVNEPRLRHTVYGDYYAEWIGNHQ